MHKFFTSLTTVAALTLAAVPALGLLQAAHAAEPTARISLVGLDLSNPAQAAEFSAQVNTAAERLCGDMARTSPTGEFTMAGCKAAVRKQVDSQLSTSQRHGLQTATRAAPLWVASR